MSTIPWWLEEYTRRKGSAAVKARKSKKNVPTTTLLSQTGFHSRSVAMGRPSFSLLSLSSWCVGDSSTRATLDHRAIFVPARPRQGLSLEVWDLSSHGATAGLLFGSLWQ